jgi:hypothetical protein
MSCAIIMHKDAVKPCDVHEHYTHISMDMRVWVLNCAMRHGLLWLHKLGAVPKSTLYIYIDKVHCIEDLVLHDLLRHSSRDFSQVHSWKLVDL